MQAAESISQRLCVWVGVPVPPLEVSWLLKMAVYATLFGDESGHGGNVYVSVCEFAYVVFVCFFPCWMVSSLFEPKCGRKSEEGRLSR